MAVLTKQSVPLHARPAPRSVARSVGSATLRRSVLNVRAYQEDPKGPLVKSKSDGSLNHVLDELKKTGMNQAKAKEVLRKWQEMGVTDEEQLRKLLVKRSLVPASIISVQTLLDSVACAGSYYCGKLIGETDFFLKTPLQIVAYFGASYYAINVLIELTFIATVVYTAYKYGTNSDQLLAAVKALAGKEGSGISVVDKASLAVNTLKVLQVLDVIADLLKSPSSPLDGLQEQLSNESGGRTTLQNLSAYLTLSRAKDKFGFDPANFNLSDREASDIAYVFTQYDKNDDDKLELSELGQMCQTLGKDLDEGELKEAMRILDTSKNGVIDFPEFVQWWVKKFPRPPATA